MSVRILQLRMPSIDRTIRRFTAALFAAQSAASVGSSIALTVGAIVATHLSGEPAAAGLPTTLYLLGGAFGAYPAGRLMDRFGRRRGLTMGFFSAFLGSMLAAAAVPARDLVWLLIGFCMMGLGRSAIDQGRFAAAELVPASGRARAVSWFVLGGAVGGIGGPLFVGPSGKLAIALHADELAGPFIAGAAMIALGLSVVFLMMRPDPVDLATRLHQTPKESVSGSAPRPFRQILGLYSVQLAAAAMIFGQIAMVAVMVITPVEMISHDQSLDAVSWVIAAHIFGMFGLSVVTGRLADTFGRDKVIVAGALLLIAACFFAPLAGSPLQLAGALFLLGLGWNFCYVSGSSLLADALRPGERGRMQGANDLAVGLTSAVGSLGSGILFATVGFGGIAIGGIILSIGLLVSSLFLGNLLLRPRVNA